MKKISIDLPVNDGGKLAVGGPIELQELLELVPKLQKKYGKRAEIYFDAGYYNVSVFIVPSIKVK